MKKRGKRIRHWRKFHARKRKKKHSFRHLKPIRRIHWAIKRRINERRVKRHRGEEGGFLDYEAKKIILPIVLAVLFVILLVNFYDLGSNLNKYTCQVPSLMKEFYTHYNNQDKVAANQTYEELQATSESFMSDMQDFQAIVPLVNFFKVIDPFVPVPCEYSMNSNFCKFYITKESYDCAKEGANYVFPAVSTIAEINMKEYNGTSIWFILLNFIDIIVVGYLVSCIVIYAYRRVASWKKLVIKIETK